MKNISRAVWVLSLISLFTDMASEMLYPIMPIYLRQIGFSVVFIGMLEGIAEATAGFSKGYFGKLSDNMGRRAPFIQIGYSLSALSKPLMAICVFPLWIFFARTLDRIGKGIRTGARDAMLSDEATPETKGKIFGLHRAMDTLGAVIGPCLALCYLYFYPNDYKTLFFIAFLPGLLAILATTSLKDKSSKAKSSKNFSKPLVNYHFFDFLGYWKTSPALYRKVVIGLLIFTLFNSSDMFLLLKAKEAGLGDTQVIGIYIFYNLIYALFALPMGILADKFGLKKILIFGLALFSVVYAGMAIGGNVYLHIGLFFLYGIYAAATEGISKAWISNISDKKDTATAIGTFASLQSICTMLASTLAGAMWYYGGAEATFLLSAAVALGVIFYFLYLPIYSKSTL